MNKKTKLILVISSFCFAVAVCVFSVFAVQNFGFNMTGTIEFVAPGIQATVSAATLSGISKKDGSGQMTAFTVTRDMSESQISALSGVQSWNNIKLLFDDSSEGKATISFKVTNNSSKATENIMVKLSSNTTSSSSITATPSADFCVGPNSNHTFTINLSVADLNTTSSLTGFNLKVELKAIKPSEVSSVSEQQTNNNLTFTTSSSSKTASFTKYTGSATSLEIPAVVKDENDKLYTVTEIPNASSESNSPFYSVRTRLKNITFPSTLTNIGHYAFTDCTGLTGQLIIPDSVKTIGLNAFESCSGITGLTLGNNLTSIGGSAFRNCKGLVGDLVIPNSVTTISNSAFEICSNFNGTLTLGTGIKTIGASAFYYCSGFVGNLTFPKGITLIGWNSFGHCTGFTGDLIIPSGVKTVDDIAFQDCTGLNGDLIIGSNIGKFVDSALRGCNNFKSITVESGNATLYSKNNCLITKEDKVLVLGCRNSVIPQDEGILKIGYRAFYNCTGFTGTLKIPNSVTTIDTYAFYGCTGITGSLTIPDSVTIIDKNAFGRCTGLTGSIIIGNSVTTIGDYAFYRCNGLTGGVTIGSAVTTIGDNVFYYCEKLSSIRINAITPPTLGGTSSFDYTGKGSIYVPSASLSTYQSATNWSEYKSRMVAA